MQPSAVNGSHGTQALPPVPHAFSSGAVTQTEPAQQPLQLVGLQIGTHVPELHASSSAHAGSPPQVHSPATQSSAIAASQATQVTPPSPQETNEETWQPVALQHPTQVPGSQAQPSAPQAEPAVHAAPPSQVHAPSRQASARAPLHGTHSLPLVPHADTDGVVQTSPAQQPLGQEVPSQTQAPTWQR